MNDFCTNKNIPALVERFIWTEKQYNNNFYIMGNLSAICSYKINIQTNYRILSTAVHIQVHYLGKIHYKKFLVLFQRFYS